MATTTAAITIRKLDQSIKSQLRVQAARNGRSMEEEAREILKNALNQSAAKPIDLATAVRRRLTAIGGGVELRIPARELTRQPPDLRR